MYGQEGEHQEHVRDRPRGSRKVHPHRLSGRQGDCPRPRGDMFGYPPAFLDQCLK